ncbi:hypothetical protein AC1031_021918 [Aphanomyces cochlioides]|nr:hypothetical protein AC1031_021918 [Aphanomyces cochlioides]
MPRPCDSIKLTRTSPVVEIGSGTGKFTELLASRFDNLTTVEPSEGMRSAFAEKFPSIPCLEGTAEHLPLPDNSQDAIYLAQAFHWCSSIDALQEFSRVLVPRGLLGLVWNLEDAQTPRAIRWPCSPISHHGVGESLPRPVHI